MNDHAAKKGFAVLYPEQSIQLHPHRCWKWYEEDVQKGTDELEMLVSLIEEVLTTHAIDRRRVYVCGMSAGAAMAHILALSHPDLIAAVGMHSGPVFGGCRSATGAYGVMQRGSIHASAVFKDVLERWQGKHVMPAILIGGTEDDVVRPINHHQLVDQFLQLNHAQGLSANAVQEARYGRASKQQPLRKKVITTDYVRGRKIFIRSVMIEGLGHAWSGGDTAYSHNSPGPDASRMIVEFFARHSRAKQAISATS